MSDFLSRGSLAELDPEVNHLVQLEAERQYRKLIMIPSESTAPTAVREALGSVFQNLYAEGYPDEDTRWMTEADILSYPERLAQYRRNADPRYYKGVEYVDIIESLTRRRCAEVYATDKISPDQLYVNVQPLSGAPANNAVYHALINPGDTILGMNLLHGGHLSHGSSVNRSGKLYKVVHYNVDPITERIDYDAVEALAIAHNPKVIIAGYSSYPWMPDWARFRAIADKVGAFLLADISHIAGLIAGGVVPSPVGLAHVISFTTHKTLFGPRSACIMTTDAALGRKIDRAVFPGEQGGPHIHAIAALAVALKIAQSETFRQTQQQIVINCKALTARLQERGLRIPFGGTDTHLANLDCKTIAGPDGTTLSGDMAARILDIAGIVLNRNTIPGDKSALNSSGIRFGTPWLTQRGLRQAEMVEIADIMADVLSACVPYSYEGRKGEFTRAKIDFNILEQAKMRTRTLAEKAGIDYQPTRHGYPHYYFLDDIPAGKGKLVTYALEGKNIRPFMNFVFSSDIESLQPGMSQATSLFTPQAEIKGTVMSVDAYHFLFSTERSHASLAATWLHALSDGYVAFDEDAVRRIHGPMMVAESETTTNASTGTNQAVHKPYFIGIGNQPEEALPEFHYEQVEDEKNKHTALYETHRRMGAKMVPFAGWEMPVWYTSVVEEHLATRKAAGLYDVSHMGVFQAEGEDACVFLDSVCANDISTLDVGHSCYTHFLDPYANVIDDTLVYHRSKEKYLVVVNASNDDKDWAWLNAVRQGKVLIDTRHPGSRAFGKNVVLRNLRDPQEGGDMRVDIALQGPRSRDILLGLGCDTATRRKIMALKRTELCEAVLGGFDLVVSRTGYTGEKMAFELFVHPSKSVELWNALLTAGTPLGLKPCGLGARDSLRTEAGLPLYGNEMGGGKGLGVAEAGFGSYVKVQKPWFIGRDAFIQREINRQGVVIRFRFPEKGVRMAHGGDPVLDKKGRVIGTVTSCAVDSEGLLTGQAFVEIKSSEEGTAIAIYQGSPQTAGKAPSELRAGDRMTLPTPAVIVSRFPKLEA